MQQILEAKKIRRLGPDFWTMFPQPKQLEQREQRMRGMAGNLIEPLPAESLWPLPCVTCRPNIRRHHRATQCLPVASDGCERLALTGHRHGADFAAGLCLRLCHRSKAMLNHQIGIKFSTAVRREL